MITLGFILVGLIGLTLGVLGGGGSVLTVPVFVYVLGFEAKAAIVTSLAVVGATSLVGAASHGRGDNVNLRVACLFAAFAMPASYLGARLAALLSGPAQLTIFAAAMLLAAFCMLRRPAGAGGNSLAGGQPPPGPVRTGPLAAAGLGTGLLTGLVGVGGGFLVVPALVVLGKVPVKEAVGTSLLVIVMNSATGLLGYLGQVRIHWDTVAAFTVVSSLGVIVGAQLVRFVSPLILRRAFAALLVMMGGYMMYQQRHLVSDSAEPPGSLIVMPQGAR